MSYKKYILGTAVKFTIVISVTSPTSVKIKIEDSSGVDKVSDTAMTKEADNVYSYSYQSSESNVDGTYVATFTVVSGGNTTLEEKRFEMIDPYDSSD